MRIDPDEWQLCRDQLTAGAQEMSNHENHSATTHLGDDRIVRRPGQRTTAAPFGHALVAPPKTMTGSWA